jgi:GMP synthase (glutamine-hydrolysing)
VHAGQQKIVIVTTGEPIASMLERRGSFAAIIQQAIGDEWRGEYGDFDARLGVYPDPREAAAFIITGSAANVPTREPWMLQTEAWLREVVSLGTPTFGICFGHQILAQALGGEVTRNPSGREIGTIRVERWADDPLFDGVPESFQANATHIDTVAKLPEKAEPMARSALDNHQVIRFSSACYGVQFHPELDREIMLGYIDARREVLAGEGFDVEALVASVIEADMCRRVLHNFVRHMVRDHAHPSSRRGRREGAWPSAPV